MKWSVFGLVLCLLMLPAAVIAALAPVGWAMAVTTAVLALLQIVAMLCFVLAERGSSPSDDDNEPTQQPR